MQIGVDSLVSEKYRKAKENPSISPGILWKELIDEILSSPDLGRAALKCLKERPTFTKKILRDRKNSNIPKPPTTWKNFEIPEELTKTTCQEQFLCMNLVINPLDEESERIIGYSSPEQQSLLQKATVLFCDGTFAFVEDSGLFKQIYIVNVQMENDEAVPVAYYFLPGKSAEIYSLMLQNLKEIGANSFQHFYIDFEAAMVKSLKEVFGPNVKISFCSVHFQRNLTENLKSKGLAGDYRKDPKLQKFIKLLWALQLVPATQIPEVFDICILPFAPWRTPANPEDENEAEDCDDFNTHLEEFIEKYFIPGYIGEKTVRTRKKPRFSLEGLSKVDSIKTGHLTTNICESQHRQLSKDLSRGKASLWRLISILKKEHSLIVGKIVNANRGDIPQHHSPNNSRKAKRVKERKRVETLVAKFETYDDKRQYLHEVAGYMTDDLFL